MVLPLIWLSILLVTCEESQRAYIFCSPMAVQKYKQNPPQSQRNELTTLYTCIEPFSPRALQYSGLMDLANKDGIRERIRYGGVMDGRLHCASWLKDDQTNGSDVWSKLRWLKVWTIDDSCLLPSTGQFRGRPCLSNLAKCCFFNIWISRQSLSLEAHMDAQGKSLTNIESSCRSPP